VTVNGFCRFDLRTTDMDAARAFYTELLGEELWGPELGVAPLPPPLVSLGVPPHWLGRVGTDDVEGSVARFIARGARQRGPMHRYPDGSVFAIVRDPAGAVLALGTEQPSSRPSPVVWHQLVSDDHTRSMALYRDLFGWTATTRGELPEGRHQQLFAWDESGNDVGGMSDTVSLPRVHPQWLYFFGVSDLEAALAHVRALGGLTLPPNHTPAGDFAACDDPQGGAFGLCRVRARPQGFGK